MTLTKTAVSASLPKAKVPLARTPKTNEFVKQIQKRDGTIAPFDMDKVETAIYKAMLASGEGSVDEAALVANKVLADLVRISKKYKNFLPTVEGIQDTVERELILSEYVQTAKNYILYRQKRSELRSMGVEVPERVRQLAEESAKYFKNNPLGEFVYLRSYSSWIEAEGRRETWVETVERYIDFMKQNLGDKLTKKEYDEVREAIRKQEIMPSMRLMQFAGKAAAKTNVCAYNCSFIAPTKLRDFAEVMYISMCGTGVGFSAESQNIQQLPQIERQIGEKLKTHVVDDSKEGWCDALTLGLETWYAGKDIDFDYSQIRPAGARLKTMGGKASGPAPLQSLLAFSRSAILSRQGRRLRNIDAHDILCKIGECVVAGGVRRSAMISLSDLDDDLIRDAKKGQFFLTDPHRSISNNSAVYEQKPSTEELMDEWVALMKSKSGERGIFNRGSLAKTMPKRRIELLEKKYGKGRLGQVGTNPCGEIILQSKQFCNLTEVVARASDTKESLLRKTRLATLVGTYQSTLTNFGYLSKEWKDNCEKERLLGVSITGQWDSPAVRNADTMKAMKNESIKVNQKYAKRFGVNVSSSITCVKPSGTVSQTINSSSGMHPRHAPYYIRRVRISATDSLFKMMKDQGVPYHPEVGQTMENANTYVLEFPIKAPSGSIFKDDQTAIEQLEYWKMVKLNFTEHNPSTTISVGDDEWIDVVNWVYKNWEIIGGLSFLPRENHVYRLAPYEKCTKETYELLSSRLGSIDYSKLVTYEMQDETEQKKELACAGGTCEIV
ncbi:ribonucleoside-triphosphate reductase [Candidatus Parcubacteria bacterium]|nr:ribonucleoside-triphosphate reductase [Candidatus Parcubacteria bacterium]